MADYTFKSVSAVVVKNGDALQYADEELRKNFRIVLAAVTQSSHALEYADEILKDSAEFILYLKTELGDQETQWKQWASERIKSNYDELLMEAHTRIYYRRGIISKMT